jgi:riboflavin synthase
MFTGLIERLGTVRRIERRGHDARLVIGCAFSEYVLGESIAVEGACLTVEAFSSDAFEAAASTETLERTTLGQLRSGQAVHLERAVALGQRLGGHVVTGHVDAVGTVLHRQPRGQALELVFELPDPLAPFVAEKGSIAIDGVSLTVNAVEPGAFRVMLVPFTRGETHLDQKRPGERVNLETDVLAKYVARLLSLGGEGQTQPAQPDVTASPGLTRELLLKQGY